MSAEPRTKRYGQHKRVDPSIFTDVKKPEPSVSALAEKYRHDTDLLVANILRKEGVLGQHVVNSKGKRVIIEITGIAQELIYKLSSLIAEALEELKRALFGTAGRLNWHHTVRINGQRLAFSN